VNKSDSWRCRWTSLIATCFDYSTNGRRLYHMNSIFQLIPSVCDGQPLSLSGPKGATTLVQPADIISSVLLGNQDQMIGPADDSPYRSRSLSVRRFFFPQTRRHVRQVNWFRQIWHLLGIIIPILTCTSPRHLYHFWWCWPPLLYSIRQPFHMFGLGLTWPQRWPFMADHSETK
jgi:hypothetical protein